MKRFSAQYIITNTGPVLKRGIVTTTDDGTIVKIEDTNGRLGEESSTEFHNGIIIPGFVNCHCHLELSHLKGSIKRNSGLGEFIRQIRSMRENDEKTIISKALLSDSDMYNNGVNLCADICNTSATFKIKEESRIRYHSFLEVFGLDPAKARKRIDEISQVAAEADKINLPYSIVPHSVYSVSLPLFDLLREKGQENKVTSIHFMETGEEIDFVKNNGGSIAESYRKSGLMPSELQIAGSHEDAVLNQVTGNGNLILVHNLFIERETIINLRSRKDLFWCICPRSNLYIENKVPPVHLLHEEKCEIVIGTDSLASNDRLSILEELLAIQENFPDISLLDLIRWSTINGAEALDEEMNYGVIREGAKPGLLLLRNLDLVNMKLLPGTYVTRLA